MRWFVRKYGVDMSEAAVADVAAYKSFNDFFTRALKEGARPLADADLICPVDGTISQFGRIEHDQIVQAKGHRYSTTALVGGDRELAARFHDGSFATLYLSPKDYHRIHMPCDGTLTRMIHVPGDAVLGQPDDGARRAGPVRAQRARRLRVRLGDGGHLRPDAGRRDHRRQHGDRLARRRQRAARAPRARVALRDGAITLRKATEMGRFLLGSTVVLLFPNGDLRFNPRLAAGARDPPRRGDGRPRLAPRTS